MKPKKLNRAQTGKKPSQIKKPSKTEKTEPNRVKTKPNRKNQAKPVFIQKNRTEPKPVGLNRFRFLKKIQFIYFFLIKTKSNRK
jgi:hypothetical protein